MPYPLALALTLAVEVPVYAVALRAAGSLRGGPATLAGIAVNLITHPPVWLVLLRAEDPYPIVFAVVEVAAWLVEAGIVYARVRRDAVVILLTALVANTASVLAGLILG